ncbi:MAG: hypothetical protein DWQ01_06050 [Planctomycetota bacterium]|nr:MAG: hypothetical protein DWQ01_06050 [Planctomycetota bacterium]
MTAQLLAAEGLSYDPRSRVAAKEVAQQVVQEIGAHPDLALLFVTGHHEAALPDVLKSVRNILGPCPLAGCTASGVIGGGREIQEGPAIALWCARLPNTRVQAYKLQYEPEESGEGGYIRGWLDCSREASVVLLADPTTLPAEPFLTSLRKEGRVPYIIGGLAGASAPSAPVHLFHNEELLTGGAVGLVFEGRAQLQPVVSQGCRPVGQPFRITRSEENLIYELERNPAFEALNQVLLALDDRDRMHFQMGPQVGLRAVEAAAQGEVGSAGFLIRPVVAVDPESGTLAVGGAVEEGTTLQFHARDQDSAHRELESLLELSTALSPEVAGALLFSCHGRGTHLFREADHDIGLIRRYYPKLPASGMFAGGEIGPVCGQPYIHGFTASIGLLVDRGADYSAP